MAFEIRALRGILAGAVCLACASRMERNYRLGAYGIAKPELLD